MNKIEVGNRLSAVELEKHIVPLAKFKKEVFEAGLVLHTAIDAETARIGPIIAKLEQGLLAEQS